MATASGRFSTHARTHALTDGSNYPEGMESKDPAFTAFLSTLLFHHRQEREREWAVRGKDGNRGGKGKGRVQAGRQAGRTPRMWLGWGRLGKAVGCEGVGIA